jgi:hypothetical protein
MFYLKSPTDSPIDKKVNIFYLIIKFIKLQKL